MSINYEDLLSIEQRRNILTQRIQQFATEAWQHEINKQTCELTGDTSGIQAADDALTIINSSIKIYQDKLAELEVE